jgi:hypothetical protein
MVGFADFVGARVGTIVGFKVAVGASVGNSDVVGAGEGTSVAAKLAEPAQFMFAPPLTPPTLQVTSDWLLPPHA